MGNGGWAGKVVPSSVIMAEMGVKVKVGIGVCSYVGMLVISMLDVSKGRGG